VENRILWALLTSAAAAIISSCGEGGSGAGRPNGAPIANADSISLAEDTTVSLALSGSDPDGDTITFTITGGPGNGTLAGTAPFLSYTPVAEFSGTDSLTFTVSDGSLNSAPATVFITVTPINDPPVANAQSKTTAEDVPVAITLSGSDPEGGPITYSIAAGTGNGTLTGTAPDLLYIPDSNFNGSDSFTFTVSDGSLDSAPVTVSITVTPVNDPPVANAQSKTTAEDVPVAITLSGSDPEGSALSFTIVAGPGKGTLTGVAPAMTYTPNPDSNGSDSFAFTVSDGALTSGSATVSITVTPVHDPPTAVRDVVMTSVDTAVTVSVAANDANPDGGPLTIVGVTSPANGVVSVNVDNTLTYTPNPGFSGSDTFTYTIADTLGGNSTASVYVGVGIYPGGVPIERVSISLNGIQGNGVSDVRSTLASNSFDGRYVVFSSGSTNLVPGDTNARGDVFLKDRLTGATTRINVASDGTQADQSGFSASISSDGTVVAFISGASNLVPPPGPGLWHDAFVKERMTGQTSLVSAASDDTPASEMVEAPSVSADGRYVAFATGSSNLVAGDTNSSYDVFVRDRQTAQTTRVSVATGGAQGSSSSLMPVISAEGRYVAFASVSPLVAGDTNNTWDIFVHDRVLGETTRVSVATGGGQSNGGSWYPAISADGRHVAFLSAATNLVAGDTNGTHDIFVHDRLLAETTRVSVSSTGTQANGPSGEPISTVGWPATISGDGRFVAFHSAASNLVAGDTNGVYDVFVHDRQTAQTIRVSSTSSGVQGLSDHLFPSISGNGRYVTFDSDSTGLVPGDTNNVTDVFIAPNPMAP